MLQHSGGELEDDMALAEFRGPQGRLTGILQIGRGRQRQDMESLCRPERASTMLHDLSTQVSGARVMEAFARPRTGRPAPRRRPAFGDPREAKECAYTGRSRRIASRDNRTRAPRPSPSRVTNGLHGGNTGPGVRGHFRKRP